MTARVRDICKGTLGLYDVARMHTDTELQYDLDGI